MEKYCREIYESKYKKSYCFSIEELKDIFDNEISMQKYIDIFHTLSPKNKNDVIEDRRIYICDHIVRLYYCVKKIIYECIVNKSTNVFDCLHKEHCIYKIVEKNIDKLNLLFNNIVDDTFYFTESFSGKFLWKEKNLVDEFLEHCQEDVILYKYVNKQFIKIKDVKKNNYDVISINDMSNIFEFHKKDNYVEKNYHLSNSKNYIYEFYFFLDDMEEHVKCEMIASNIHIDFKFKKNNFLINYFQKTHKCVEQNSNLIDIEIDYDIYI